MKALLSIKDFHALSYFENLDYGNGFNHPYGSLFLIFTKLTLLSIGILVFSVFLLFMTFFSIEADYLKRENMIYNLFEKL